MTTYAKDIDLTEGNVGQGLHTSCIVGSGGVTVGKPVMWDGSNANTVVACTGTSNVAIGIASDTVSQYGVVTVLGNGCLVKVPYTLTVGGKVGISTADLGNYSTGTCIGTVQTSATSASIIRVQIQY